VDLREICSAGAQKPLGDLLVHHVVSGDENAEGVACREVGVAGRSDRNLSLIGTGLPDGNKNRER